MRTRIEFLSTIAVAAFGITLGSTALGQSECETDADCEHGFECQVTGGSTCPDIACAEGEECEPIDCESEVYRSCVPGSCEADADCATGMVCHTQESQECSDVAEPACDPEAEGCTDEAAARAAECETRSWSQCVYTWELPCETASDCGEGFDCVEQEQCWADGGGADSGGTNDEEADVDADTAAEAEATRPAVQCEPSGISVCIAQEIECESDSDCPSDWSCVQEPYPVCGGGSTGSSGGTGTGGASSSDDEPAGDLPADGVEDPATSPPPDSGDEKPPENGDAEVDDGDAPDRIICDPIPEDEIRSTCQPPHYYGGDVVVDDGRGEAGSDDLGSSEDPTSGENTGEEVDNGNVEVDLDEDDGEPDTVDSNANDDEEIEAPDVEEPSVDEDDGSDDLVTNPTEMSSSTDSSSGCSVDGRNSGSATGAWLLSLLGLGLLRRRRS